MLAASRDVSRSSTFALATSVGGPDQRGGPMSQSPMRQVMDVDVLQADSAYGAPLDRPRRHLTKCHRRLSFG